MRPGRASAGRQDAGLRVLGVSYGGNDAAEAVMPMDWPESAPYDRRVLELVSEHRLAELASFDRSWVEAAAADSWWQLLMLEGALAAGGRWRAEVHSYEAPTYFGMLAASYERVSCSG